MDDILEKRAEFARALLVLLLMTLLCLSFLASTRQVARVGQGIGEGRSCSCPTIQTPRGVLSRCACKPCRCGRGR